MKRLLFLFLIMFCSTAAAQQFVISANGMFDGNNPSGSDATLLPQMQSADFNQGLAMVTYDGSTDIENLLSNANSRGIQIILNGLFSNYGWAERFYLEGTSQYFTTIRGSLIQDTIGSDQPPNDQSYYNREPLEADSANMYMVEGAKIDPVDPWVDTASYTAYFRLKVQRSGTVPSTWAIASIEVWDGKSDSEITSEVLYSSSFQSSDTYYDFPLTFQFPFNSGSSAPVSASIAGTNTQPEYVSAVSRIAAENGSSSFPDPIDLRVKWYGNPPAGTANLFLDDIRVESTDGKTGFNTDSLFSGYYNDYIKSTAGTYDSYPALSGYYLKDEPYVTQFLTFDYLNTVLDSASGSHANGYGLGTTQKSEGLHSHGHDWTGDPWIRYVGEGKPYELDAEVDKFLVGDPQPGASDYTDTAQSELQNEMGKFDSAEADCHLTVSGAWQAYINSSSWNGTYREPHVWEISAQVYCALAHGAKGIDYFDYLSSPSNGDSGLVYSNWDPVTSNIYGEDKWDSVAAINENIANHIGPVLMNPNVTFQQAYSIDGSDNGSYGFVDSAYTTVDPRDSTYIELGEFSDNSGNQYLMVVNRRTDSLDTRDIRIRLSNSSSQMVRDVSSGKMWILAPDGSFSDTFSPGYGKLYEISPATWSDTVNVVNRVAVQSGATLTVNPGTVVNFANDGGLNVEGVLTANGTSSQPIQMTRSGGVNWGSITFNGSGADNSSLEYCNVSYDSVIEAENTSNITIDNCSITNSSYYGIDLSGASNVLVQYNTIANGNIYDGVVAVGGSNDNCYWNTIYKFAGSSGWYNGIGIVYSASSGTIGENDVDHYAWGISSMYGASIYADEYPSTKNNRVNDCSEGLMVYNNAFCQFGEKPSPSTYGLNSIDSCSQYFNVYNSSTIYAIGDYWGSYPPNNSNYEIGSGGTAYYSYPLSYDPWNGAPVPSETKEASGPGAAIAYSASSASVPEVKSQSSGTAVISSQDSMQTGMEMRQESGLVAAMNYFISFVKRHPDDAAGYVQLYGCTNDTTLPAIFGIFKALPSKASPIERLLLSNLYQMEDDPNVAMAVDDSIIADYPNNPIAVRAELSNMLIDLLDNDDISGARTVLQNIKGQAQLINPIELRDDEAMFALNRNGSTLKTRNEPAMSSMYKVLTVAPNLPKTYGLLQNYPNPFNPTTTIDYQLPRDSHVTIRVYDILGQLVATLVNSEESAGYHRAVFNGSRYASGIYFYRMTTPSYSKVQKMLLLK